MDKRAAAFAHYNDAAVLQMLIQVLPEIAREVAAPIASIDQLTVLSTDGAGALPKQVTDNVVQTLQMLKTATGIDLQDMIARGVSGFGGNGDEPAAPAAAPKKVVPRQGRQPRAGRGGLDRSAAVASLRRSGALETASVRPRSSVPPDHRQSTFSATYVVSRYSSMPSKPPSRPKPLALTPPNGAAGLETSPVLIPTMPKSSDSASRMVRARSRV